MRPAGSIALAGAFALVQTPVLAEGGAEALGVMSVSLSDVVKPRLGIQGQTQGAGTPNQAGVGGYLPLVIGENSVLFLDALANVNFGDFSGYSSIINTEVSGITISTSSRLGYRWLNDDRSWMFGINAGYDSRPMATGRTDTGVTVTDRNTVFFQQVAAGIEAVSDSWNFNAYALIPVGTEAYQINSNYSAAALDTYGLDVGYSITPDFRASVGYYYQHSPLEEADGSGVDGRLAYDISNGLVAGVNLSYDQAFETRVSADLKYRFGADGYGAPSKKKAWNKPTIKGLTETVKHRDVRVHDKSAKTVRVTCQKLTGYLVGQKDYFTTKKFTKKPNTKYANQWTNCKTEKITPVFQGFKTYGGLVRRIGGTATKNFPRYNTQNIYSGNGACVAGTC